MPLSQFALEYARQTLSEPSTLACLGETPYPRQDVQAATHWSLLSGSRLAGEQK